MISDNWDVHIGSLWGQLLSRHSLGRDSTVVEIGPGFSDKIGRCLAERQFQGKLYVIEPDDAARRWATARYVELLGKAEIVPVAREVSSAGTLIPERVDALLMNHVLDDMILHAALTPDERSGIYGGLGCYRESVSPLFRETWQRLLADASTQRALCCRILEDLKRLTDKTSPRIFGASQYPSWFLHANGLEMVDRMGAALLRELSIRVGSTSDPDRAILQRSGQDPDRWLFVDRHSPGRRRYEPHSGD